MEFGSQPPMDARSRGRETDLRRRAVAWEPSADQSDGGAARGGGASFEPSGDAGGTNVRTINLRRDGVTFLAQAVVRHLPAIDATEGKDEVAVLCDKLCDDIRDGLLQAIDKACPGQPAYLLGGIQINGPTEGPELLAIRHFELRAPDGTLTDKMAALERALDLQVNGFN